MKSFKKLLDRTSSISILKSFYDWSFWKLFYCWEVLFWHFLIDFFFHCLKKKIQSIKWKRKEHFERNYKMESFQQLLLAVCEKADRTSWISILKSINDALEAFPRNCFIVELLRKDELCLSFLVDFYLHYFK